MTAFVRQIATAKRLIEKNGANCTWRQLPDATPDTLEPWKVVAGTPKDFKNIRVVILPYTRMGYEFLRLLTGTEIQIGDVKGLMAQQAFKPSITDVLIHPDGTVYRINKLDPLAPDGTPILYTLDLKV